MSVPQVSRCRPFLAPAEIISGFRICPSTAGDYRVKSGHTRRRRRMSGGQLTLVLNHIRHLARAHNPEDADTTLLERFAQCRDEGAFVALVRRHGPMVLRACRRVLGNAQTPRTPSKPCSSSWRGRPARSELRSVWPLGCTASRIACPDRATATREAEGNGEGARHMIGPPSDDGEAWRYALPLLDNALEGLPVKYKQPLVLCYLQGRTHAEAARELRCPPGSLSKRLARARELLRDRLAARSVALSAGAVATLLAEETAKAAVSASFVMTTTRAAVAFAGGQVLAGLSGSVVDLAKGCVAGAGCRQGKGRHGPAVDCRFGGRRDGAAGANSIGRRGTRGSAGKRACAGQGGGKRRRR